MATSQAAHRRANAGASGTKGLEVTRESAPLVPSRWMRPVIGAVSPQVEGGRRPAKAAVGDLVLVEADVYADGHDVLVCALRFRHDEALQWSSAPMESRGNDRWQVRRDGDGSPPLRHRRQGRRVHDLAT
jgi:hypothetical protein